VTESASWFDSHIIIDGGVIAKIIFPKSNILEGLQPYMALLFASVKIFIS
jgi:hypothetical protein